jgi:hypothetical protein
MKKREYKNMPIGCYFDSTFGQTYNDLRVLELALEFGWQNDEALDLVETEEDDLTEDQREFLSEIVDEAIEYLNDQETRPFLFWQWENGDFGLYPDIEGAKEDCGFVSFRSLCDARSMGIETDPEDPSYPPDDYVGEWLHVSDHGNCTLYIREKGEDKEIWSLV